MNGLLIFSSLSYTRRETNHENKVKNDISEAPRAESFWNCRYVSHLQRMFPLQVLSLSHQFDVLSLKEKSTVFKFFKLVANQINYSKKYWLSAKLKLFGVHTYAQISNINAIRSLTERESVIDTKNHRSREGSTKELRKQLNFISSS